VVLGSIPGFRRYIFCRFKIHMTRLSSSDVFLLLLGDLGSFIIAETVVRTSRCFSSRPKSGEHGDTILPRLRKVVPMEIAFPCEVAQSAISTRIGLSTLVEPRDIGSRDILRQRSLGSLSDGGPISFFDPSCIVASKKMHLTRAETASISSSLGAVLANGILLPSLFGPAQLQLQHCKGISTHIYCTKIRPDKGASQIPHGVLETLRPCAFGSGGSS
jgi:hypothetical protein